MKKLILSAFALTMGVTVSFAGESGKAEEKDNRMSIMVGCIATPDTRTDVMFKPVNAPKVDCPFSDADLQGMTGK